MMNMVMAVSVHFSCCCIVLQLLSQYSPLIQTTEAYAPTHVFRTHSNTISRFDLSRSHRTHNQKLKCPQKQVHQIHQYIQLQPSKLVVQVQQRSTQQLNSDDDSTYNNDDMNRGSSEVVTIMKSTQRQTSLAKKFDIENDETKNERRKLLLGSIGLLIAMSLDRIPPSNALVKGNAPPSKLSSSAESKIKCTNVEECQEMAERREQQLRMQEELDASGDGGGSPILTTKLGTKYRDIVSSASPSPGTSATTVQDGDVVTMYYKVLKLGKRSYDGLSGEGTVIFSCGYGLEDDESTARSKTFTTTIGNVNNIVALNDGMIGMQRNTVRRIQIVPNRGWRKPDSYCDGGPGGSGIGGTIKTDYVVVPTATMVATEICMDTTKLPFPNKSYAEQRRMAQRFDQSLLMEVEVIDIQRPS